MRFSYKFAVAFLVATTAYSSGTLAGDFSGFYVGAEAGGGSLDSKTDKNGYTFPDNPDLSGALLGIETGYNMLLDSNIVLGISGDLAFSSLDGDDHYGSRPFSLELNWLGTLQAKGGLVLGDTNSTMLYLGGGLAVGEVERNGNLTNATETHTGYVLSLGIEQMLGDAISVKAEAGYVDLGKETYSSGEAVKLDGVIGTVGVNFHL